MHSYEVQRMKDQEAEYVAWERAHSDEIEAEAFAKWVETLCEGHESLAGADMGRETYCDGTCRPKDERSYDAWVTALEADDPSD